MLSRHIYPTRSRSPEHESHCARLIRGEVSRGYYNRMSRRGASRRLSIPARSSSRWSLMALRDIYFARHEFVPDIKYHWLENETLQRGFQRKMRMSSTRARQERGRFRESAYAAMGVSIASPAAARWAMAARDCSRYSPSFSKLMRHSLAVLETRGQPTAGAICQAERYGLIC